MKQRNLAAAALALLLPLGVGLVYNTAGLAKGNKSKGQPTARQVEGDSSLSLIQSEPNSPELNRRHNANQVEPTELTEQQKKLIQKLHASNTPELRAARRAAFYQTVADTANSRFNSGRGLGDRTLADNVEEPGCRIDPASPSIGADVPATYFGPPPSSVQKELIGPLQLLTAGQLDKEAGTITLPLYRGQMRNGKNVWYILTDTTDQANAAALGLNFSAKLNYSATGRGVRNARLQSGGLLVFEEGEVNFKPERMVKPSPAPNAFPPMVAEPGSMGDSLYTPLVRITNAGGHIYNAPVIAFDVSASQINFPNGKPDYSLLHDAVVSIDTKKNVVTMRLVPGFSFARPVLYLSTEASDPLVAALEGNTFSPGLSDIDVGNDDSAFSAVERLFLTINGPTGCGNPQRQGMNSALIDGRAPLNVLGGVPTIATDYSPLWDVNVGVWTEDAIRKNYRSRVSEEFQILALAEGGFITGLGGAPYGSAGFIVNCPIVFRFL